MKKTLVVVGTAIFLAVALPLHAQTGCGDSPENPTAILALLGSAGAFVVAARARFNARKSK
jgi:XrtJ-associated TM-motif-TM protein